MKEISVENMISLMRGVMESMDTMTKYRDRVVFDCGLWLVTVYKDGMVTILKGCQELVSYDLAFRKLYRQLSKVEVK